MWTSMVSFFLQVVNMSSEDQHFMMGLLICQFSQQSAASNPLHPSDESKRTSPSIDSPPSPKGRKHTYWHKVPPPFYNSHLPLVSTMKNVFIVFNFNLLMPPFQDTVEVWYWNIPKITHVTTKSDMTGESHLYLIIIVSMLCCYYIIYNFTSYTS